MRIDARNREHAYNVFLNGSLVRQVLAMDTTAGYVEVHVGYLPPFNTMLIHRRYGQVCAVIKGVPK